MSRNLTFVINPEGQQASLELFQKTIEDIRRLIRDLDYAVTREKGRRRWVIEALRTSAPTITVRPLLENDELIETIVNGVASVSRGTEVPPDHFNEPSLEDLRRMQRLFRGGDRARNVTISHNEHPAVIERDIGSKVDRILAGGYSALGSIQGVLDAINLHGPNPVFTIWDSERGTPIHCSFPKTSEWVKRVEDLLQKLVMVKGTVNYFKNGLPRSIVGIKAITDETPDANLPRATFGCLSGEEPITDVVDFLKRVREGV